MLKKAARHKNDIYENAHWQNNPNPDKEKRLWEVTYGNKKRRFRKLNTKCYREKNVRKK